MASREEMISFLKSQNQDVSSSGAPSREEMISFLQKKQSDQQAPVKDVSKLESFGRGALQGASLGFADEISGGVEALWHAAKGDPQTFTDLYRKYRDESRANFDAAQSANPKSYGAGELSGAVGTLVVPGLNAAKGASLATKVAAGARVGAAMGLGNSQADLTKGDVGGAAADTAKGAAFGGALQYGGETILSPLLQRGASAAGTALNDIAETRAAKALGATKAAFKRDGQDQILQTGRAALDNKIITPLASTEDMAARAQALKQQGGTTMGQVYKTIDQAGASTFNPLDVASKVDEKVGGFYRSPINRGETNQLENTLESILMRGDKPLPLEDAQTLKEELGKVANWKNKINVSDKEKMAREAYGVVNDAIDQAADQGAKTVGVDGLKETLQQGKDQYKIGLKASKLLDDKAAAELGNKTMSLTDTIAAIGGYAALGPKGLAILATKKLSEKYGNQLAATGADKISKFLLESPELAQVAQKSPATFQSIVQQIEGNAKVSLPQAAQNDQPPAKGPDKWAADGYKKLLDHASESDQQATLKQNRDKLMKDPKNKDLLIKASDLKPGTKAMSNILDQLNNRMNLPGDQ